MAPHAEVVAIGDTESMVVPEPVLSNGETQPVFSVGDVLPHRQKSAPLPSTVAAFSNADMFKSKAASLKPKSRRWDHRISRESAARNPSSLKGAMKHFRPDMISLCGGLPSRYIHVLHET